MEVEYVVGTGDPRIDGNTIFIPNKDTAHYVVINTDRWVVVHHLPNIWFFFVDGRKMAWGSLCDSQRLALKIRTRKWHESCQPNGKYDDDRYYILEGLEASL